MRGLSFLETRDDSDGGLVRVSGVVGLRFEIVFFVICWLLISVSGFGFVTSKRL